MQVSVFIAILAGKVISALAMRRTPSNHAATYESFRQRYGRADMAEEDPVSYEERLRLFLHRQAEIKKHNAKPTSTWVAGLNKFADYTDAEFHMLLGHRPSKRGGSDSSNEAGATGAYSFIEVQDSNKLATSVNWTHSLMSIGSHSVKDQGACGSCWAVAASGALEMKAEILEGKAVAPLSYEQLIDCVDNPRECGGQGGCKGATAELAFGHVANHGIAFAGDYKGYQSGGDGKCKPHGSKHIASDGFERLPTNKLQPLLGALNNGPVVVSVDASKWGMYSKGVFAGCDRDAIVNHAVLMTGYGQDTASGNKYFLIRNSWGDGWGENGYIRLNRRDTDEGEAGFCGMDAKPQEGVACKGEDAPVPVCGDCGVLSDSAFPKAVRVVTAAEQAVPSSNILSRTTSARRSRVPA
jgi:cathepsin L